MGLDKLTALNRIGITSNPMPGCEHKRTEFLMRRDGVDYLTCLDCDQVFESDDLEVIPSFDESEEAEDSVEPRRKRAS